MRTIFIATSNPGKLRDFAAAAGKFDVTVAAVPDIANMPPAREDAPTFEANACKKAEHYSRLVKGSYVLADDSGLEVDALLGAPGVHSARFAASNRHGDNASDEANNAKLLTEMRHIPDDHRSARFVCCIAVARDGRTVRCFRGEVAGRILRERHGSEGFGYDPLFYIESAGKTFGQLKPSEKAGFSHRGEAFRKFLKWYSELPEETTATPAKANHSGQ